VKNHIWLRNYDWQKLYEKSIPSPYIPPETDNFNKGPITWKGEDEAAMA
jgi:hypothetical protein